MRILGWVSLFVVSSCLIAAGKNYTLVSPDERIKLNIQVDNSVCIEIRQSGKIILEQSAINLKVNDKDLGINPKVVRTDRHSVNGMIIPTIKIKAAEVKENYNQLTLDFKGNYSLIFRAYDEGVAYRFKTNYEGGSLVNKEELQLNMPASTRGYLMQEKSFLSMSESPYICAPLKEYEDNSLFSAPFLFQVEGSGFLLVSESDLTDYPGLWLQKTEGRFHAVFPQKVINTQDGVCINERFVTERAGYLAETAGKRSYPWRVFVVTETETELITNQLIYLLGTPALPGDYSWIKPGLATLDWWGRRNIFGTAFPGEVNTETHKYFVDFNHTYGLKYFVLDDGWSHSCDLKKVNKDLDLDELKVYAEQKGVGLVFWVHAFALKQDIPGYLDFMQSKGAKGIKVDFFERDDQDAVNLFHEIAREALKRQMIVDFHGACKPFGLNRTYPNVLTSEGLIEFEMNGVTDWANPDHHTLLPFIRMVAGPMDYLPGTMNNAQKREFSMVPDRPVGLGSRSHAMALSVIYESPLTMLPDSPSDYLRENECMSFLSKIPVVWDETKVLDAKIGEYVIVARRCGTDWFIGAITNWKARDLSIRLDFLSGSSYTLEYFKDGINTVRRAIDYQKGEKTVSKESILHLSLSTGGGWVGKITK